MSAHNYPAICERCGIERKGGATQRTAICRDCASVLSPAERQMWMSEPMPYCHTCKKHFRTMGVASHRAAHRRRRELVKITLSSGTYVYDYRESVAA